MPYILVIDDDRLVGATLKRLLNKEGHKVSYAQSGKEALGLVEQADFDLIISDIKMPEMDGVETVKKIRQLLDEKSRKSVPEIFITAFAKEEMYNDALALNAVAYIEKPFDMKSLLGAIKKAGGG